MKPRLLLAAPLLAALAACGGGNENLERATALHPAGREVFEQYNCIRCHENGDGGYGPRLIDNARLRDLEFIKSRVRNGEQAGTAQMPAYPGLSDEELADVANFVRALAGWE